MIYYEILAAWATHRAVEDWIETGWEGSFPEVGEGDYGRITDQMKASVSRIREPDHAEVEEALQWMKERADAWVERNDT